MRFATKKIVILAAGISSRMKLPATAGGLVEADLLRQADERGKAMIEVGAGGRPFLDYLLYNCREVGLREVVLVIGRGDDIIKKYYGPEERGNAFTVSRFRMLTRISPLDGPNRWAQPMRSCRLLSPGKIGGNTNSSSATVTTCIRSTRCSSCWSLARRPL